SGETEGEPRLRKTSHIVIKFRVVGERQKGSNGSEMKCREVEDVLVTSNTRGTGNLTASVRAHIEGCKSCQEFARIVELPSADAQIDSSQIDRLQKMIVGDLQPVRPLLPSWVFLLAFALIFVGLSYLGVLYLGPYGWFVLMPGQ